MKHQYLFLAILFLVVSAVATGQEVVQKKSTPAASFQLGRMALSSAAAVPQSISYQGLLTTTTGTPVADGSYALQFDLYDTAAGGASQWSEIFSSVPVQHGTFSVILDTMTFPFTKQFYLQVTATSGPAGPSYPLTFSPRTQLTSAPYALAPWIPTGSDLYYNNGNVGIGTTTPIHRLSIGGGPSWTSNFWKGAVELENASAIAWQANAAGQRFGIGHTNGGLLMFRTASNPGTTGSPAQYNFMITDSGNVGIGTTFPAHRLHVADSLSLGLGWPGYRAGAVTFYPPDGSGWYHIDNPGGQGLRISGGIAPGVFDYMTIAHPGNVGIGTTSPAQQLHVSKAGDVFMRIDPQGVNRAGQVEFYRGGNAYSWVGPSSGNQWHIWSKENIPMLFAQNDLERMRIDIGGNVGIGTAGPQQNLSVNAAVNIDQADANNGVANPGLTFGSASGEGIASKRTTGANQYGLDFYTNFTNRMTIGQWGNVGIGTLSPQSLLHVAGDVTADAYTKLGSDAPAIRMKKITGTTAASQGSTVTIPHGLVDAKILSVSVLVSWTGTGGWLEPGYKLTPGYEFYWYGDNAGNIKVANMAANSSSILSAPMVILITYEQ